MTPDREPMPGRYERAWCPHCNAPAGPDCPTKYRSKRTTRRRNQAEVRRAWFQAWLEGR